MNANGDIDRLVQVQGPIVLAPATAEAYLRMKAAAAREGVTIEIPTPAGGYRSLAMQQDMHDNPAKYNLDPRSSIPLAPVGWSTHGLGDRVDIIVGKARTWAIENAARFGFYREFGDRDPGHFRFRGTTLTATTGDDDMPLSDADKDFINRAVAAGVQQVKGEGPWAKTPGTIATVRADINHLHQVAPGYSLKEIGAKLDRLLEGGGDLTPILEKLRTLPKDVREEFARGLTA